MARSTITPKDEADLERLTQKIQATQKMVEQSVLEVGEDLARVRETKAYRPDTFTDYCLESFGLLPREIYRYINAFQLVRITQSQVGETPRAPYSAERILWSIARKQPEKLKDVQVELKKKGSSLAIASAVEMRAAVAVVMHSKPRKKKSKAVA